MAEGGISWDSLRLVRADLNLDYLGAYCIFKGIYPWFCSSKKPVAIGTSKSSSLDLKFCSRAYPYEWMSECTWFMSLTTLFNLVCLVSSLLESCSYKDSFNITIQLLKSFLWTSNCCWSCWKSHSSAIWVILISKSSIVNLSLFDFRRVSYEVWSLWSSSEISVTILNFS